MEPAALARLKEGGLAGVPLSGSAQGTELSAVYFDGADHPLSNSDITLRVEKTGRRYRQRLESRLGGRGTATLCKTWEGPISNSNPVLSGIDDQNLRRALAGYTGDRLQPVYRTKVERTTRRLTLKDGSELTADSDIGEIWAAGARQPISELTLRLGSSALHPSFDLALEMLQKEPLRIATESLAKCGLALLSGRAPESRRADKLDLSRDATVEDALIHTVQHCLDHLLANEACVLGTEDPEGIHQMRVALRRFRSALRLFRELLPEEQFAWLNEELRFLTNEMAAARDWDVFAEEIVAPTAQGFPDQAPFRVFQHRISAHRNRSRHTARNTIFSKRYTEFLLRLSAWLTGRVWRDQPLTEDAVRLFGPITAFAAGKLAKLHKRVDKAGRKFEALSVPERHQMRIEVKRLRYASDFFSSFYPRKAVKPYSEGLANLQDALGYLNDVAVAEELVARTCEGARGEVLEQCRFAGGVIIGWHSRALADSEQRLIRNVGNFIVCRPFWSGPA
jgi:inorganic triphosphatase YgiF